MDSYGDICDWRASLNRILELEEGIRAVRKQQEPSTDDEKARLPLAAAASEDCLFSAHVDEIQLRGHDFVAACALKRSSRPACADIC